MYKVVGSLMGMVSYFVVMATIADVVSDVAIFPSFQCFITNELHIESNILWELFQKCFGSLRTRLLPFFIVLKSLRRTLVNYL